MSHSTYQRLIHSATKMFAQRGFYGTSIRDIADQLDISKQALLHHFSTKEKLYGEVLKQIAEQVMERVNHNEQYDSATLQIETAFERMAQWGLEDLDGARVLMRELLDNAERAPHAINWYLNPLLEAMVAIIKKGQSQGEFKKVATLAFIYNLLGAQHYFMISLPTLKQMLSEKEYKSILKQQPIELKAMMLNRLLIN